MLHSKRSPSCQLTAHLSRLGEDTDQIENANGVIFVFGAFRIEQKSFTGLTRMSHIVMNGRRVRLPAAKVFRKVLGFDGLFTEPEIPLGGDEVSMKQNTSVFIPFMHEQLSFLLHETRGFVLQDTLVDRLGLDHSLIPRDRLLCFCFYGSCLGSGSSGWGIGSSDIFW